MPKSIQIRIATMGTNVSLYFFDIYILISIWIINSENRASDIEMRLRVVTVH